MIQIQKLNWLFLFSLYKFFIINPYNIIKYNIITIGKSLNILKYRNNIICNDKKFRVPAINIFLIKSKQLKKINYLTVIFNIASSELNYYKTKVRI